MVSCFIYFDGSELLLAKTLLKQLNVYLDLIFDWLHNNASLNFFLSIDVSEENVLSITKSCKPADPVYKPTPISILEKRTENSQNCVDIEFLKSVNCLQSVYEEPIPVYQPTPISELEKYAPNSLSDYEFSKGFVPQDQPSYSPVVKIKPAVSTPSLFSYQPSPVVTESSASLYATEVIDINIDSDDDTPAEIVTQDERRDIVDISVAKCNQNSQDTKLTNRETYIHDDKPKRRKKPSKDKGVSSNNESNTTNTVDKRSVDSTNKDSDDDNNSSLSKRQKILSLYQDLYGDTDKDSSVNKKSLPTNASKSTSVIPPYVGPVLKKPGVTSSDKKDDNRQKILSLYQDLYGDTDKDSSVNKKSLPTNASKSTSVIPPYVGPVLKKPGVTSSDKKDDNALEDEQACHDKATSRMAYLNAVIQRLKSLKAEKTTIQLGEKSKISCSLASRPINNSVPISRVNSDPCDLNKKKDDAEEKLDCLVKGPLLYSQLTSYLLSEEDLSVNGYPLELKEDNTIVRGKATLLLPENKRQLYGTCKPNERVCCRCGTRFLVDEFGHSLTKGECIYHWGKAVKQRSFGRGFDLRYLCCDGEIGQLGCQICPKGHVHDANKWLDNEGFVVTLPPLPKSSNCDEDENSDCNVYALDCEMVYTTGGCELARITIVNSKYQPILDEFVCPDNPVIDCNSRFSGLKLEDIEQAKYHITDIQAKLLNLFDSDTILVGHSLESDLIALKLIHKKIVDTSIVFPHRLGLPNKRALRNLVSEILQQIIQQDENGHNSMEDAVACMQLVHYKVKEDLRRGKWNFS
ncbi:RNA exonuclease 1 [Schistosoma japonicum]|uniref:RNA exonuclease 1 n=1 Tax=Schistosoma japonicum TaxID=6182 RepID=A0A4Z2DH82_SCHJA|nr:RNA exonuclease 1 [Schistosoma japonicum]